MWINPYFGNCFALTGIYSHIRSTKTRKKAMQRWNVKVTFRFGERFSQLEHLGITTWPILQRESISEPNSITHFEFVGRMSFFEMYVIESLKWMYYFCVIISRIQAPWLTELHAMDKSHKLVWNEMYYTLPMKRSFHCCFSFLLPRCQFDEIE